MLVPARDAVNDQITTKSPTRPNHQIRWPPPAEGGTRPMFWIPMVKVAFMAGLRETDDPGALLQRMNATLCGMFERSYVTAASAVLRPDEEFVRGEERVAHRVGVRFCARPGMERLSQECLLPSERLAIRLLATAQWQPVSQEDRDKEIWNYGD